jgi:hypothetical protein
LLNWPILLLMAAGGLVINFPSAANWWEWGLMLGWLKDQREKWAKEGDAPPPHPPILTAQSICY